MRSLCSSNYRYFSKNPCGEKIYSKVIVEAEDTLIWREGSDVSHFSVEKNHQKEHCEA